MITSDKTEIINPAKSKENKIDFKKKLTHLLSLPLKFTGVKTLLLLVASLFIFFNGFLPDFHFIDNQLFELSGSLKKEKFINHRAAIITIDPKDFDSLLRYPEDLPELIDLLKIIKIRKNSTTALLMDDFPYERKNNNIVKKLLIQKEFYDIFKSKNINIALRQHKKEGFSNFQIENFIFNDNMKFKVASVKTHFDKLPINGLTKKTPHANTYNLNEDKKRTIIPVLGELPSDGWPMIWQNNDKYIPDILSIMFSQISNIVPEWEENKGLLIGYSFLNTDPFGYVLPLYSDTISSGVKTYSLRKLLKTDNFSFLDNKAIFIGEEKDPILTTLAETYVAISSGNIASTPWQAVWLEKILICVFFLFLILIVPRIKNGISVLISIFIIISLLILQSWALIIKDQWLLFTLPIIYLIAGLIAVLISQKKKEKFEILQQKANLAFLNLGRFQFEQNRFDQAFTSLIECKPEDHVLELLYKLGVSFERKRQYDKACTVFEYIDQKNAGYNDAGERAERLTNIIFGRTSVNLQTGSGTLEIAIGGANKPILGRYEIEKELGRGAMGIVYLGEDPKIGRKIAIKTMDFTQTFEGRFDEVKERFFREAKAAGRLTHPNIVTIYDAGEEQDLAYIAMDYVPGITLNEYTKTKVLLPVKVVYDIICQVAEALNYAHRKEIVHRDIKPGNIIYNKEIRSVTVTDFGIARIADTTMTRPGVILGSPSFMSPEQLRGKNIDGRADIFSLGVTMYQLLTGKLPFTGTDLSSLGYQITSVKHPSIMTIRPDLPKSADKIINRALQKNPMKRYQTAEGMARALRTEIASLK